MFFYPLSLCDLQKYTQKLSRFRIMNSVLLPRNKMHEASVKLIRLLFAGFLFFSLFCVFSVNSETSYTDSCYSQVTTKSSDCVVKCWVRAGSPVDDSACFPVLSRCKSQCSSPSQDTTTSQKPAQASALSVSVKTNANTFTVGDPYTLSVTVKDASTGSGVAGASLSINYYNQKTGQRVQDSGTTNSAGIYSRTGEWSEGAIGTITITVTATKSSYASGSASTTVTVTQVQTAPDILSAAFSATPLSGRSPLTVHFTDKSTGHPVKWKWDFGDGYTSTSQNPVHTYTALEDILGTPEHFTVTLTVWDAQSSDVATKVNYITVYPATSAGGTARTVTPAVPAEPPRASFSASPATGTAPLRVYFSDTSTGTISSWLWDFGDGYRSEVSSPSHTFKEPGTYTVRLTVSGAGLSDTARKTITVHAVTGGTAGVTEGPTSPVGGSDTSRPPPGTGDGGSLSPEEIGGGVAAAVAGAIGGLVALGSGALSGILPGMRPPPGISPDDLRNLQEEYQNLMDTLATERANRDA